MIVYSAERMMRGGDLAGVLPRAHAAARPRVSESRRAAKTTAICAFLDATIAMITLRESAETVSGPTGP